MIEAALGVLVCFDSARVKQIAHPRGKFRRALGGIGQFISMRGEAVIVVIETMDRRRIDGRPGSVPMAGNHQNSPRAPRDRSGDAAQMLGHPVPDGA